MSKKKMATMQADSGEDDMMMGADTLMQNVLSGHYTNEYKEKPKKIRERAEVLMSYHEEYLKLQRETEGKEMVLRQKYDKLYESLYQRRTEIITGTGEALTDAEVAKGFPAEHEGVVTISGDVGTSDTSLPQFWLRVLQHNVAFAQMIEPHDEDILEHLVEIASTTVDGGYGSFSVVFTFKPNDYLVEEKLTITLQVDSDSKDVKVKRSPISWKPGKDPAVDTAPAPKKKGARAPRVQSRPTFFDIFTEKDDEEGDMEGLIGLLQLLHNSLVPSAVNYYTGEAPDGSSDIEDDDEDDDDDDDGY